MTGILMELDIEYENGWRETVDLRIGETFTPPSNGKIVGQRTFFEMPDETRIAA